MKTKTLTPLGSLHPVLFFAGVYLVALVFSIFICSALFYSCNSSSSTESTISKKAENTKERSAEIALR
jgi:hypothetical protein